MTDLKKISASVSGPIIFFASLLSLLYALGLADTKAIAVALVVIFILIESVRLNGKQKLIISVLSGLGLCTFLISLYFDGQRTIIDVLGEHLKLVMLLAAISFIRLVSTIERAPDKVGMPSYLTTLGGMHVFSAVANFSSVFMVGEQLYRNKKLGALSQIILGRGFSMAVLWSPFLSILPLTLEIVPNLTLQDVVPYTLALTFIGIGYTIFEAKTLHANELEEYSGYPLKRTTLVLPIALIMAVLVVSWIKPSLATVTVVTIFSLLVPISLLLFKTGLVATASTLTNHVVNRISETRGEIGLFFSAGVLAGGVKACLAVGLITMPIDHTNATVASIVLIAIYVIASMGVHQFALVAIFAGLLHDITTTPVLMAIAYILGTSLAMSGTMFSALSFILQSLFGCGLKSVVSLNFKYTIIMIVSAVIFMHVIEFFGVH